MANTLIKVNVTKIEGVDVPQGVSPNNFQVQLFSKSRVVVARDNGGEAELIYTQYQTTNKNIKINVAESLADVLAALETNSDANEKFKVSVLAINGVPLEEDRVLTVDKVIKVVKDFDNPNNSVIFYEINQGQDPQKIKVSEDLSTIQTISSDGYYSDGLASELL